MKALRELCAGQNLSCGPPRLTKPTKPTDPNFNSDHGSCLNDAGLIFSRISIPTIGSVPGLAAVTRSRFHFRRDFLGGATSQSAVAIWMLEDFWLVVWNIFSIIYYMGCHPKLIDELHHFSRLFLHHQAESNGYL